MPKSFDIYASKNIHVTGLIYDETAPVLVYFPPGVIFRYHEALKFGEKYSMNMISVATAGKDWFQYPDLSDAEEAIRSVTRHAPRVVAYGASMGGYGALLASKAIGADAVLAFSPQAAIGPDTPSNEVRWQSERAQIGYAFGFPNDRMADRITRTGDVFVVYDPFDPDARHVARIAAIRPIRTLKVPFSGHGTVAKLAPGGHFSAMVRSLADGSFEPGAWQKRIAEICRSPDRLEAIAHARLTRRRALSEAMLIKVAQAPEPVATPRLRRYAQFAATQSHAEAVARLLERLMAQPDYAHVQNVHREAEALARVAARWQGFSDGVRRIASVVDAQRAKRFDHLQERYEDYALAATQREMALAYLHLAVGDTVAAGIACDRASMVIEAWSPLNAAMVDLLEAVGKPDRARDFARRIAVQTGPDLQAIEKEGAELEARKDWAAAAAYWRTAMDEGVDPHRLSERLAKAHFNLKDYGACLSALAPLLAEAFVTPTVLKMAGTCHARMKQNEAAIALFERVVAQAPTDHGGHRLLSSALAAAGDLERALASAREAHRLAPSEAGQNQIDTLMSRLATAGAR